MVRNSVLPRSLRRRLISTLMGSQSNDSNASFVLKSSGDFASRSGDVFGGLQSLEKNHQTWIAQNETYGSFEETNASDVVQSNPDVFRKPFPAKASVHVQPSSNVFRKPFPAKNMKRKFNSGPQFQRERKKWTKYSLSEVPLSSDATNSAVALQFISEMRERREKNPEGSENEEVLFRKPKQKGCNFNRPLVYKSNLCVTDTLPAPVSVKNDIKQVEEKKSSNFNITLDHLQEH